MFFKTTTVQLNVCSMAGSIGLFLLMDILKCIIFVNIQKNSCMHN